MDGFAQLCLDSRIPTQRIDRATRERLQGLRSREEPGPWLIPLPILPQEREQPGGQHDAAILLPFPLPNAQHHTAAVNIRDLELTEFGDPEAGGIERREDGACFEPAWGLEDGGDFRWAEDRREGFRPLGLRDEHARLVEGDVVEKAQGTDGLHDERPRDVPLVDEIELILADVLGAQPIRSGPKGPRLG